MSDGYQVTMSNLLTASSQFRGEGRDFGALMRADGLPPVNGGSPAVDDALTQVLRSIGLLHGELSGLVGDDAANLAASYREYQWAEDKSTTLAKGKTVNPSTIP